MSSTQELPGAARPSGTYTVEGQRVEVRLFLSRGAKKIGPLKVEGTKDNQADLTRLNISSFLFYLSF